MSRSPIKSRIYNKGNIKDYRYVAGKEDILVQQVARDIRLIFDNMELGSEASVSMDPDSQQILITFNINTADLIRLDMTEDALIDAVFTKLNLLAQLPSGTIQH